MVAITAQHAHVIIASMDFEEAIRELIELELVECVIAWDGTIGYRLRMLLESRRNRG